MFPINNRAPFYSCFTQVFSLRRWELKTKEQKLLTKNKSELILETKINAKPHPTERLNRRYLEKGACTITAVGDTCTLCCKIQLIHFTCMSALHYSFIKIQFNAGYISWRTLYTVLLKHYTFEKLCQIKF